MGDTFALTSAVWHHHHLFRVVHLSVECYFNGQQPTITQPISLPLPNSRLAAVVSLAFYELVHKHTHHLLLVQRFFSWKSCSLSLICRYSSKIGCSTKILFVQTNKKYSDMSKRVTFFDEWNLHSVAEEHLFLLRAHKIWPLSP